MDALWRAPVLALLIAGCATPAIDSMQPATARPYREEIDLTGRLSVHYQLNGREEAVHGSFNWLQAAKRTTVTLLSPLGQTMAKIEAEPAGATLAQAGQPLRSAPDADALAAEALGWPLPVAGLRRWLQGYADSAAGCRFVAAPGNDSVSTPDGWRIHYVSWQDNGTQAIPKRIDLERDTAQAGQVALRIVIDSWQPQ